MAEIGLGGVLVRLAQLRQEDAEVSERYGVPFPGASWEVEKKTGNSRQMAAYGRIGEIRKESERLSSLQGIPSPGDLSDLETWVAGRHLRVTGERKDPNEGVPWASPGVLEESPETPTLAPGADANPWAEQSTEAVVLAENGGASDS